MIPWPAAILACLLTGCAPTGFHWIIDRAADAWLGPQQQPAPTGPALRFSLGGRPGWFALVSDQGGRRIWRSAGQEVIITEGDRVVATGGFPVLITASRLDGPDPLADPQSLREAPRTIRRVVDLMTEDRRPAGMSFGVTLVCRLEAEPSTVPIAEDADEDAEIGFIEASLVVTELCSGNGVASFANRFTINAETGAVRRSVQWIGPDLPPIRLGRIRRPS